MPNNLCDAWGDLIFSKNRGQIYDFFNRKRKTLIKHLQNCDICENMLAPLLPATINDLDSKTPLEFATLIRVVYSNAQGMNFEEDGEDDAVNSDHD